MENMGCQLAWNMRCSVLSLRNEEKYALNPDTGKEAI